MSQDRRHAEPPDRWLATGFPMKTTEGEIIYCANVPQNVANGDDPLERYVVDTTGTRYRVVPGEQGICEPVE